MGSVRKKGDRWYYSIELPAINGKRKRIERSGGKTKKEALQKMAIMEAEILKNGYREESKMTFNELYEEWFKNHVEVNLKYNTIKSYKDNARLHILPKLGNYKVVDIKAKTIHDYFNQLKLDDCGKSSANHQRCIIKSCLDYAVFPLEIIESNPCENVKMPKITKSGNDKKIITQEMFKQILDLGKNRYMFNELCILLYHTGMRVGEALGIQWSDIDFENKIIHIRHTLISKNSTEYELVTPKTKNSIRDIYFNEFVERTLKKIKTTQNENRLKYGKFYQKSDLVFTKENGMFFPIQNMTIIPSRISKKLDFTFSMHTFRHTHATILLQAGVNMKEIQTRLGHSDISTTMNIYVESTEESKKNTSNTFDEFIKKTSDI